MAMQLAPEEPEAGPWRIELLSTAIETTARHGPAKAISGRPVVLAVDGRSNAGKTTLAARVCRVVPGSAVVHTDDIAWEHSRFGWADLFIEGILVPVHQGRAVSFRPPRWTENGRDGSIKVPAGCPLLIVEGDGAGRKEAARLLDYLIWVQSDEREADRRSLARAEKPDVMDIANMPAGGSPPDDREWMAEEIPFNAAQRTWERADVIVCGTPELPCDPVTEIVTAPPLAPAG